MRRIGLFGGSFNPPHIGHRLIAEQAIAHAELDSVLWMPARQSPFKSGDEYAAAHHRLEMVRIAVRGEPEFEVSRLEMDRPPPSYSVDTLRSLTRLHPGAHWVLLIGADSYNELERWREPEAVRRLAQIAVYPRPGHPVGDTPGDVLRIDAPLAPVSSTAIRRSIRFGGSSGDMVAADVRTYIETHGLYVSQ